MQIKTLVSLLGHENYLRLRWLASGNRPWKRSRLKLYTRGGGIGDEMLSLSIIAEIKRLNPKCHITFYTRHPIVSKSSKDVDEVVTSRDPKDREWIQLSYEHQLPPKRPIITLMAECVGLDLRVDFLAPPRVEVSSEFRARVAALPRPLIVVQPKASKWTPNKDWPAPYWYELLNTVLAQETCHVVEVGVQPVDFEPGAHSESFTSLAGQTSVAEYIYLIGQGDLFVGPPSSGMHLANSYRVPNVIIYGGYESPMSYNYPQSEALYNAVPCAPCWKTVECPYARECLHGITPHDVFDRMAKRLPALVSKCAPSVKYLEQNLLKDLDPV